MIDEELKCTNCRFFRWHSSKPNECRRLSPTSFEYKGNLNTYWPAVHSDDWCGEFQPSPLDLKEGENK